MSDTDTRVLAAIKRARTRPITATEIAQRSGFYIDTVRRAVARLLEVGEIAGVGQTNTGERGRPATLYTEA